MNSASTTQNVLHRIGTMKHVCQTMNSFMDKEIHR